MSTNLLPIVGDTTSLGEAARAATAAKTGAVVVANTTGLWIMPIGSIPDQAEGPIGVLVESIAARLKQPGSTAEADFTIHSIKAGFAEVEVGVDHPWQVSIVYGFKECNVNEKHTFPPTYRNSCCSPPCHGKLVLRS